MRAARTWDCKRTLPRLDRSMGQKPGASFPFPKLADCIIATNAAPLEVRGLHIASAADPSCPSSFQLSKNWWHSSDNPHIPSRPNAKEVVCIDACDHGRAELAHLVTPFEGA